MAQSTDAPPTVANLYAAVCAAYTSTEDTHAQHAATVWLEELRKSLYSWSLCDQVLREKSDAVACNYAANTMRRKVLEHFEQLPREQYKSLQDSLIEHILSFRGDDANEIELRTQIITQLCLALVDLLVQVPTWTDFIPHLFQTFESHPRVLLLLLKFIAEENASRELRLGENRRDAVRSHCAANMDRVVQFVTSVCSTNGANEDLLCRALNVFEAWLRDTPCPTDALATNPLLLHMMQCLKNDETSSKLHHVASQCCVSAMYRLDPIQEHEALAITLRANVLDCVLSFERAVNCEEIDKVHNFAEVFVSLAEAFMPMIVAQPGLDLGDVAPLDLLLTLATYHDYSVINITFNAWYRLSDDIYQDDTEAKYAIFCPYIEKLIMHLYKHARYDTDIEGLPDKTDDFAEFRVLLSECVKDVIFMIGTNVGLKGMFTLLTSMTATSTWDETEAALYIIACIANNVDPDESAIVRQILAAVVAMGDETHVALRETAVRLIGELAEWVNKCADEQLIHNTIEWMLRQLPTSPALADTFADTMDNLVERASGRLTPFLDHLIQLALHLNDVRQCDRAVDSLLKASSFLLKDVPVEETAAKIDLMCAPQIARLEHMIQAGTSATPAQDNKEDKENRGGDVGSDERGAASTSTTHLPTDPFNRLAAIFRPLSEKARPNQGAPWLPTVERIWPLCRHALPIHELDKRFVEYWSRAMRLMIRSLGQQSLPFVNPLAEAMVTTYQKHNQHSCLLYLASILVDEYGTVNGYDQGLMTMVHTLANQTYKVFTAQGLVAAPHYIDDLYRMASRCVQRCPLAYYTSGSLAQELTQCASAALNVDHVDSMRSVNKYLIEVYDSIRMGRKQCIDNEGTRAAEVLYVQSGEGVIKNILSAALHHHTVRHYTRDLAEILQAMCELNRDVFDQWLQSVLGQLIEQHTLGANAEQLQQFHAQVLKAPSIRETMQALRELAKLYR